MSVGTSFLSINCPNETGILSTFANKTKIDVKTALEVHGNCGMMSMFKDKNTEGHKIKTLIISRFQIDKDQRIQNKNCIYKYSQDKMK